MTDSSAHRRRSYLIGSVLAIAAALAIGLIGRGHWQVTIAAGLAGIWLAAPTTMLLMFLAILMPARRSGLMFSAVIAAMITVAALGGTFIGWLLGGVDARNQMAWAEQLAAVLEQHKTEHGEYPETVEPVIDELPAPPARLAPAEYRRENDHFVLTVPDRRVRGSHWIYNSTEAKWTVTD